jgi:hypothetical protein
MNPKNSKWKAVAATETPATRDLNSVARTVAGKIDSLQDTLGLLQSKMTHYDRVSTLFTVQDIVEVEKTLTKWRHDLFGWGGISFLDDAVKTAVEKPVSPKRADRLASLKTATINDYDTLYQLVDMEVENLEGDGKKRTSDGEVTTEIRNAAEAYDRAVEKVLTEWVKKNTDKLNMGKGPLRSAKDADDVVSVMMELRGGAGYLYFMEAEGHGVGTWDGDWDVLFDSPKQTIKELSKLVKDKTRQQYDKLKQAMENEAFECVPDEVTDKTASVDQQALNELELYMENESSLHNQKKSIILNILRKKKGGRYDHNLAPKLWAYWVESGAKAYVREFGGDMKTVFPKPLRDQLAKSLADEYNKKIDAGEYSDTKVAAEDPWKADKSAGARSDVQAKFLKEMEDALKKHGYDPKDAKKLQKEGMGPEELEERLKVKSGVGSLEHTHNLKKKTASSDQWKAG